MAVESHSARGSQLPRTATVNLLCIFNIYATRIPHFQFGEIDQIRQIGAYNDVGFKTRSMNCTV